VNCRPFAHIFYQPEISNVQYEVSSVMKATLSVATVTAAELRFHSNQRSLHTPSLLFALGPYVPAQRADIVVTSLDVMPPLHIALK
jgi:hypothetical protein